MNRIRIVPLICACWIVLVDVSSADRIILKDGTIEESHKIWETDHFVHFILNGTDSVEIRFSKEIVDRIERENRTSKAIPKPIRQPKEIQEAKRGASATIAGGMKRQTTMDNHLSDGIAKISSLQKIGRESKGIPFYDPRRSQRYWASKQSQHKELRGALMALAQLYGRTPQWVEANMGVENDLESVHRNLLMQRNAEFDHTGQDSFDDRQDAEHKLAPPEKSADSADQIGENTTKEPHPESGKAQHKKTEAFPSDGKARNFPALGIPDGTKFYNPRRPKKYWVDQSTHFSTLREAIEAFAVRYQVSPDWVEKNIGDTNDLLDIHRNIRKNLSEQ